MPQQRKTLMKECNAIKKKEKIVKNKDKKASIKKDKGLNTEKLTSTSNAVTKKNTNERLK